MNTIFGDGPIEIKRPGQEKCSSSGPKKSGRRLTKNKLAAGRYLWYNIARDWYVYQILRIPGGKRACPQGRRAARRKGGHP